MTPIQSSGSGSTTTLPLPAGGIKTPFSPSHRFPHLNTESTQLIVNSGRQGKYFWRQLKGRRSQKQGSLKRKGTSWKRLCLNNNSLSRPTLAKNHQFFLCTTSCNTTWTTTLSRGWRFFIGRGCSLSFRRRQGRRLHLMKYTQPFASSTTRESNWNSLWLRLLRRTRGSSLKYTTVSCWGCFSTGIRRRGWTSWGWG